MLAFDHHGRDEVNRRGPVVVKLAAPRSAGYLSHDVHQRVAHHGTVLLPRADLLVPPPHPKQRRT